MTNCAGHGRVRTAELQECWPQTQDEVFQYFPGNIGPAGNIGYLLVALPRRLKCISPVSTYK